MCDECGGPSPSLGIPAGVVVVVMVGEMIARKRHADGIRALARINNVEARLILVGDGPLQPELGRLAKSLSVQDRVIFAGRHKDVRPFLAVADVMLMPSSQELHAQQWRRWQWVCRCWAQTSVACEMCLASRRGCWSMGDVQGLAEAMDRLIDLDRLREQCRTRGLTNVERFRVEPIVEQYVEIY